MYCKVEFLVRPCLSVSSRKIIRHNSLAIRTHLKLLHHQICVTMSSITAALAITVLLSLSVIWKRSIESWKEKVLSPPHPSRHVVITNLEVKCESR